MERKNGNQKVGEARADQLVKFNLDRIEKVLTGKEKKAVLIVSYNFNLEDGSWSCTMPPGIRMGGSSLSAKGDQLRDALPIILFDLGYFSADLVNEFLRELENADGWIEEKPVMMNGKGKAGKKVRIKEKTYPIKPKRLTGRLTGLDVVGEYEMAFIGRHIVPVIKEGADERIVANLREEKGWQILVRRKVEKIGYNRPKVT